MPSQYGDTSDLQSLQQLLLLSLTMTEALSLLNGARLITIVSVEVWRLLQ